MLFAQDNKLSGQNVILREQSISFSWQDNKLSKQDITLCEQGIILFGQLKK